MRFRVFPIAIFACLIMLSIKVLDVVDREQNIFEAFFSSPLSAEEVESEDEEEIDDSLVVKEIDLDKEEDEGVKFSQTEIDILQRLSQRREELDRRQHEIELKENVLQLTQGKIKDKIAKLRVLKKEVEDVLSQYNKEEDLKIKSLVKIYENMKPQDAAKIFEKLEMAVLMEVVSEMSERKVSPVLAKMSPDRAQELTIEYATRRRMDTPPSGDVAME